MQKTDGVGSFSGDLDLAKYNECEYTKLQVQLAAGLLANSNVYTYENLAKESSLFLEAIINGGTCETKDN